VASAEIREALGAARAYVSQHPEQARYTDSAATAILNEGLAVTISGPDGATIQTDMPQSVGGNGAAPSPGWLLRAAQASCVATLIAMRAAQLGLDPGPIEVVIDSESDDRGILGIDDSVAAGPLTSRARVRLRQASGSRTELVELVSWADSHCPVQDAVRRAVHCTLEVEE